MKRIFFAAGSLIIAFAICFAGYFILTDTCEKLEASLDEIVFYSENGNAEKSLEKANEIVEQWEDIHGRIEAFVNHSETDELEELIKSLPVYARLGNTERLCEKSEIAINRLQHLVKNEKVMLSNII